MTLYILGLDGASLNTIEETSSRTRLPNFEKLFVEGSFSELRSVYPYVTAPAWTTIFSGVNPGKHGVFEMFKVSNTGLTPSNMTSSDIPFLWDYLTWANKKTLAVGIPFFYPAPKIKGAFISGRFCPSASFFPSSLGEKFDLSPFEYDHLSMEEKTLKLVSNPEESVSSKILEDLRKRVDTMMRLVDSDSWDCAILIEGLPDDLLHVAYGTNEVVDEMYRELDRFVGLILSRLRNPGDALMIISDHGFRHIERVLYLNEWLRQKGYAKYQASKLARLLLSLGVSWDTLSSRGMVSKIFAFLVKHFPRALEKTGDTLRSGMLADQSAKFGSSQVSVFSINEPLAWLRISEPSKTVVSVDALVDELAELKETGILKKVFKTSEIYSGRHTREAPGEILVEAADGWSIDTLRWNNKRLTGKPLFTKKGVHQREGVVFFYGNAGDGKSINFSSAKIHDVVPTVLSFFKLPLPRNLDGVSLIASTEIKTEERPKVLAK